jgi:predicted CXXCH cytochrome family protein
LQKSWKKATINYKSKNNNMKKRINYFLAVAILLVVAQVSFGQTIVGSAHDFSGESWNTTSEICIVCHTPHNADMTVPDAPLWNHEVTAITNYVLYSSLTFDGASSIGQPDGSSKLCLSCHDGTVALENFSGMTTGTNYITGANLVGTNLSDDHPISFDYDAALAGIDLGLFDPTTTSSGLGGTITNTMLYGNKMQCASCHDVHNGAGVDFLLRKSNVSSALCLTCHNK